MLEGAVAEEFFALIVNQARQKWLLSDDRFTVDGTMIEAWAGHKSFRYALPVIHTETNYADPGAVKWLYKEWANVHRLKQDGVPLVGFT